MPAVRIIDRGCRGCELCVDLCPVKVFERTANDIAAVVRERDCIGCLSCIYLCPSRCIEVDDVPLLRPFHRIEEHAALIEKFLQEKSGTSTLTEADWEEARKDVAARLFALSATVLETIGRGHKAIGRRAGALAAAHFPEMYEEAGLDKVLSSMQHRFRDAFEFDYSVAGESANLNFHPCGLCRIVEDAGEKVGEAVLCQLFHEYWAGVLGAFVGVQYRCEVPEAGKTCRMELKPAR
jgi:NAD-dependent dihydropyrimidine dehydrogenase PreA subunit